MREPGPIPYDVTTVWQFDAPIDAVWDAIADVEGWPGWWAGVERVVTLARGDAAGLGVLRRLTCKGVLPFRLTIVTRVTRVEPPALIEGRVEGELEGIGRCRLSHDAGLTTVRYDWQVRTTRLWMNLLGPLGKPVFRWNHQAMMHAGGRGLARHLDARRGARTVRPS
jgi:polyketide cyclase/dehydrase/lipid transport protein